jgi:hypothetical protein
VRSEAERDLAGFDGWALSGVDNVINRIQGQVLDVEPARQMLPRRTRRAFGSSSRRTDWQQCERHLSFGQFEKLVNPIVIEGADDHCAETERVGLQVNVLAGVAHLDMDVTLCASAVFGRRAPVDANDDEDSRGLGDGGLTERSLGKLPTSITVEMKAKRVSLRTVSVHAWRDALHISREQIDLEWMSAPATARFVRPRTSHLVRPRAVVDRRKRQGR